MMLNRISHSTCPHCGNDHLYQLGDGRNKCSACQRKFSPVGRRTRLTDEAIEAIVSGFSDGTPASAVATSSGLNPKTVQLYYGRIRELLATDREQYLARCYGSAEVSPEIFTDSGVSGKLRNAIFIGCLVASNTEIELFFVNDTGNNDVARLEPSAVSGWLVAADRQALENKQLDGILCLAGSGAKERARIFWLYAKHRLAAYCGGFKKHFRLYLREMEFRDNMESTATAHEHIGDLLERNTITSRGEKNA